MKKVLLSAAIAALMGTGIFLAKSTTPQNDGLSDINIANAEALADDEIVDIPCVYSPGESCTFDAKAADGTMGKVTLVDMKKVENK